MKIKFSFLCLFLCQIIYINEGFAQKNTPVGGTKISMLAPPIMAAATRFYGFQNDTMMASIMIMEMPVKMKAVEGGFSDKTQMKAKGMTLISNQNIKISGKKAILVKASQVSDDVDLVRFIVLCDNDSSTIMLNGLCPKLEENLAIAIEKALLSAEISKTDFPITQKSRLNIEGTIFKHIERLSTDMALYSVDKVRPSLNPTIMLLGIPTKVEAAEQEKYAENGLKRRNRGGIVKILSTKTMDIKGFKAYETIANITDKDGKTELSYTVMLFSDKEAIHLVGSAQSDFSKNTEIFRKIALTFQ